MCGRERSLIFPMAGPREEPGQCPLCRVTTHLTLVSCHATHMPPVSRSKCHNHTAQYTTWYTASLAPQGTFHMLGSDLEINNPAPIDI